MAKIQEEIIIIKLSKLVKDGTEETGNITDELLSTLTSVAEELVGNGIIVEAEAAK